MLAPSLIGASKGRAKGKDAKPHWEIVLHYKHTQQHCHMRKTCKHTSNVNLDGLTNIQRHHTSTEADPTLSHLAGVDTDMDCGSIGLFSLHALDVDDVLLPVDLHHFANLLAFVVSADHLLVNTTTQLEPGTSHTYKTKSHPTAITSTVPGLHHPCGWAWTSRCTSDGAPWRGERTWSSSWCVRGHWSAFCGSCGGRRWQTDWASWCWETQGAQVITQATWRGQESCMSDTSSRTEMLKTWQTDSNENWFEMWTPRAKVGVNTEISCISLSLFHKHVCFSGVCKLS